MEFDIYKDINNRTGGEVYIGVVGPVRTGKSTFIKNFIDLMVLPNIIDENEARRTIDELPQSAAGRTIMTTEPKFIPKTAVKLTMQNDISVQFKLIDCVGYMVKGAEGAMEDGLERKVKTPWYDYEIPFSNAAEIGTRKVVKDHSTIAVVVTTDGSFGEIERESYVEAETNTILELKELNKPFVVVINSTNPMSRRCQEIKNDIETRYAVTAICMNCLQMTVDDINNILERILFEFPIIDIEINAPAWIEILEDNHPIKEQIIETAKELLKNIIYIKDIEKIREMNTGEFIQAVELKAINLSDGNVKVHFDIDNSFYYQVLTDLSNTKINNEYELICLVKELSKMKMKYEKVNDAIDSVRQKGYGIVSPERDEIMLEKPELIRNGNKYGIKIKATAPSIHFVKADVVTEIAPIIGTKEQAEEMIEFISEKEGEEEIWDTNIFGKSVEQIVDDGINSKINRLTETTQINMQNTIEKITNEQNRGVICILL